jgi:EAL domain-containing protein (putative c-di-GMP-specific phosphodiesterase class I)
LANPDFAAEIAAAVAVAGIDPSRTVIEITETERSPEFPQFVHKLGALWRHGFRVALDDFAGEDIPLLAHLAFDYVKIDIGLLHESAGEERRRKVLSGLHRLITETGAKAIAEGVETDEDFRLVAQIGFEGAQGFMVGRPEPRAAPRIVTSPSE